MTIPFDFLARGLALNLRSCFVFFMLVFANNATAKNGDGDLYVGVIGKHAVVACVDLKLGEGKFYFVSNSTRQATPAPALLNPKTRVIKRLINPSKNHWFESLR